MKWWKLYVLCTLAALGALGCGSSKSSTVSITVSPTATSVITNRTQQFTALVTGSSNTAVTWSITCATGVTANTCGSIDASGLYTAPATIPATTSNGTTTVQPAVTVTGTAQADTSKISTATITIVTGISIVITPTSATVGTGETFLFTATVNNPGCNLTSNPTCQNVTWSLSTTLTGIGTIDSKGGVYKAPTSVPSPSTVVITATSVADTSVTATATVTVVTASTPTVTSVSPNTTGLGGVFQDIYITGTNFISTDNVFINGVQLAPAFVTGVSTSLIRARIPDFTLSVPPPSGVLQISVSEQSGAQQTCTADPSACQVRVVGVRPGLVGPTPSSISQGNAAVLDFGVDGGFFGIGASPAVTATFNNQLRGIQLPASQSIGSTRHLTVSIGGSGNTNDFSTPGLFPVAITNATDPTKFAVANLAIQPTYTTPSTTRLAVGSAAASAPADVAVNPATGIAVVANKGSNDVSLIDLNTVTPTFIGNICTGAIAAAPPCPASGPTSVSIDYVLNRALVVNSTAKTLAVIDLNAQQVTNVLSGFTDTPVSVGINPITKRAVVAMKQTNYGVLVDLTSTPTLSGIVSISTGANPQVAIEPHLNWALVTPGGLGSLGIVDLNRQSSNQITAISRTTNVVTVSVQSTAGSPPLSVQVGDAVQIQNIQFPAGTDPAIAQLAAGFNGFYTVSAAGPGSNQFSYTQTGATLADVATQTTPQAVDPAALSAVNYSQPVATVGIPINTQGVSINPVTQQAVLVDPSTGGVVSFFSLIDQSLLPLGLSGARATTAAAFNPLTNTALVVDSLSNILSVIDPVTPRRLNENSLFSTLGTPVAVAVDPGSNIAVIANQGDNSVSVLNMGAIQPFSITETSPKVLITSSTLTSPPSQAPQQVTIIGKGLTCNGGSPAVQVRLDGQPVTTSCSGTGDRKLTATVPFSLLGAAHRFVVDVQNNSGAVTNAESLTVEQSVDVSSSACPTPEPSGVAIDPQQNIAAVSLFNCDKLALINMATGTGTSVVVGSNPIGVAVIPRLHVAVVANNGGAGTASIVDEVAQSVTQTVSTGSGPVGAAADEATGQVAIANSVANTVSVVNAVTGGVNTISTGQRPLAVGFNYTNHQVAVAATGSNTVGVSDGSASSQTQTFNVQAPTSIVFDPVPTDCGSNFNGTTSNTTGCFIVASSTGNTAQIIDPVNSTQIAFRVGINPTAVAYNFRTSTLVSTNTASHTITVADLLAEKIRSVLTLPPAQSSSLALSLAFQGSLQYALDIHPFTNVAVIADTVNGRVVFVPVPY